MPAELMNSMLSRNGGALYSEGSFVSLKNCTFLLNIAAWGGAFYATDGSNMTLVGCSLKKNLASWGGAAVGEIRPASRCRFML